MRPLDALRHQIWNRRQSRCPARRSQRGGPRPRVPGLDAQRLEPRLALAAAASTKATQVVVPAAGAYAAGGELAFQITFNNPVTLTGNGQPTLNLVIGKTTVPAAYVAGSGTATLSFRHVVATGQNDADGIAVARTISLPAGSAIVAATTGQAASLAIAPPSTAKVLVDTASPTVASLAGPPAKTYAAGQTLSFTANFTESVFVTGSPTLPVTIGDRVRDAVWNGKGSGSKALVFTTTILAGDSAPLGVQTGGAIRLAGAAAIRDRAGNHVVPTVSGQYQRAKVDGVAPAVTSFGAVAIDSKTKAVSLQVTFGEPVAVAGGARPFIPFTLDGVPRQLVCASGSGTGTLTFRYAPSKQETPTPQNVAVPALAITLPATSSIADVAGNRALSLAAPTDVALSATLILENNAVGAVVGSFTTTDPDAADHFAYALVAGAGAADNASFSIDAGQLKAAQSFVHATKSSYGIRVRATDAGGLGIEKTFTIGVTDVNHAPTDIGLSAATIAENNAVGAVVGTLSTTDVDAGDSFSYALVDGEGATDNAAFTIVGGRLEAAQAFDFETKNSYSIRVRTTDAGGLSTDGVFAISVTNVNTIVHFDTNLLDFDVELFDAALPNTVANFLAYVQDGTYAGTLIHRSTTYNPAGIQIVQGGGFALSGNQLAPVATRPPIALEAGSGTNARGTIAMARGAATDSATSQFFFNVQANPALDGNYVVFGAVVGAAGLAALDALGAVTVYDCIVQLGAAFGELPLTAPSLAPASLVLVNGVTIVSG